MELRLIETGISDLIPQGRSGDERYHISVIIRKLCLALGHYEDGGPVDETVQTRFEIGNAFELAVINALAERHALAYPDRYIRPGQIELDGLMGNPDLVDTIDWAVHEMKLTWLSSRNDPEGIKFWKYWVQLKAYCHMWGTDLGRLHVAFVNGDYAKNRKGPPIDYRVWEARFTKAELIENWRMLKSHAA